METLLEVLTYCKHLKKQATSLEALSKNQGFSLLTGNRSWKEIHSSSKYYFFPLKGRMLPAALSGKNRTCIFI